VQSSTYQKAHPEQCKTCLIYVDRTISTLQCNDKLLYTFHYSNEQIARSNDYKMITYVTYRFTNQY